MYELEQNVKIIWPSSPTDEGFIHLHYLPTTTELNILKGMSDKQAKDEVLECKARLSACGLFPSLLVTGDNRKYQVVAGQLMDGSGKEVKLCVRVSGKIADALLKLLVIERAWHQLHEDGQPGLVTNVALQPLVEYKAKKLERKGKPKAS